ncbi:hypothetical protein, partial [Streptomyces werraensis]|uniref:hypothetical protein n=1 Tax=Streptomyces werraensis TaxID=68284 RepID=UPI001CE3AF69
MEGDVLRFAVLDVTRSRRLLGFLRGRAPTGRPRRQLPVLAARPASTGGALGCRAFLRGRPGRLAGGRRSSRRVRDLSGSPGGGLPRPLDDLTGLRADTLDGTFHSPAGLFDGRPGTTSDVLRDTADTLYGLPGPRADALHGLPCPRADLLHGFAGTGADIPHRAPGSRAHVPHRASGAPADLLDGSARAAPHVAD